MSPHDPGSGRADSSIDCRMCSTDADDRFPTAASDRHVGSNAASANPSDSPTASTTFGPPG